jgi:hypothetical protein
MTPTTNDDVDFLTGQVPGAAENQNLNFVPSVARDLALLKVSSELESAVLGLRRKLTLKKFLTMKLSEPMFALGSVQATARQEMMKLPGLNGTQAEASQALQDSIKKSKLYARLGYWVTYRCYFSVFDIYKALLAAQRRNDLIIRDFKNPRTRKKRERNPARLVEAKIARLSRWAMEQRTEASLLREKASQLLVRADRLESKAVAGEQKINRLNEVSPASALPSSGYTSIGLVTSISIV